MKARLTRAESKARTRADLVDAARRVFLERGYHAASVADVAAEAGFSTGALYSAFRGKADLFLAVLDAHLAERIRGMEAVVASATTAAEHAEQLARQFATVSGNDSGWSPLVIEFWAHAARDPELRKQFAERHDSLKQAIAGMLDEMLARTGERLVLSTDEVAMAAAALANGLTLERLAHPDGVSDERFADLAAFIMKGLSR
ncbi:TetR/AcrR family transcriptional regulator [Kribbella sp. VKM Ac-2568]|uniref:TetR/AcrR family transcriptional regulator n=1 Tax=Kribbella sp. VKM Ac-2568 TaxID=2512219 RepID=UPI001044EE56|nr:TetR/AcrR family transcriptional regulator [Kribbella sp. VKM Ac-2568]TCM49015.1 TetR family transcriptional regulator [Kribbella sp. VKM Ac-2568]